MNITQLCSTLCNPMDYIIHPWNSLGQNTGVGSLSLLQGIFPTQRSNPGFRHLAIEKDLVDKCLMKQCLWKNRSIMWYRVLNFVTIHLPSVTGRHLCQNVSSCCLRWMFRMILLYIFGFCSMICAPWSTIDSVSWLFLSVCCGVEAWTWVGVCWMNKWVTNIEWWK